MNFVANYTDKLLRELCRELEISFVSQIPFGAVDDKVHGIVSFGTVHDKVHGIVKRDSLRRSSRNSRISACIVNFIVN